MDKGPAARIPAKPGADVAYSAGPHSAGQSGLLSAPTPLLWTWAFRCGMLPLTLFGALHPQLNP